MADGDEVIGAVVCAKAEPSIAVLNAVAIMSVFIRASFKLFHERPRECTDVVQGERLEMAAVPEIHGFGENAEVPPRELRAVRAPCPAD
jgi:hypothetical protein